MPTSTNYGDRMADEKTPQGREVRREASDALALLDSVGLETVSEELKLLRELVGGNRELIISTRRGVIVAVVLGLGGIIATLVFGLVL